MKQSGKYNEIKNTIDKILTSSGRDLSHYGTVLVEQLQDAEFEDRFKDGKQNDIKDTANIIGFEASNPSKEGKQNVKKQMNTLLIIVKKED